MKNLFLSLLLLLALMSGLCACVGPVYMQETARTVGASNVEIQGGYGYGAAYVKANFGLLDNLDLGVQLEYLSYGLRLKYATLNSQIEGLSLAIAGGGGISIGGWHAYMDLISSYLVGRFEPYLGFRFVYIDARNYQVSTSPGGLFSSFSFSNQSTYGQAFFGSRFLADNNIFISAEGSVMFPYFSSAVFCFGGGLGYKF